MQRKSSTNLQIHITWLVTAEKVNKEEIGLAADWRDAARITAAVSRTGKILWQRIAARSPVPGKEDGMRATARLNPADWQNEPAAQERLPAAAIYCMYCPFRPNYHVLLSTALCGTDGKSSD